MRIKKGKCLFLRSFPKEYFIKTRRFGMNKIFYSVLCSRVLTPLQHCKICSKLKSAEPESEKAECKVNILESFDYIISDAEELFDGETDKELRKLYEVFIMIIIEFKKRCFECDGDKEILYLLYKEIGGNFESNSKNVNEVKVEEKKVFLHNIKEVKFRK